jgi:hypothetical protein
MEVDTSSKPSNAAADASVKPSHYKIFVHGETARVTGPDGSYTLIDFAKKQVTQVNPSLNMASSEGLGDFEKGGPNPVRNTDIESVAELLSPASVKAVTLAGCPAKNLDFSASAGIAPPSSNQGNPGFGRHRGGGGGIGFQDGHGERESHPTLEVSGTVWVTPANSFGAEGDEAALAMLAVTLPRRAVVSVLWEKLKKSRSLPLDVEASITSSDSPGDSILVTGTVMSIKFDDVDPTLLVPPKNLGEIDAPKTMLGLTN